MRSDEVKKGHNRAPHRSLLRATGLQDEDFNKPFRGISFVSQHPFLIQGSILENIIFGSDVRDVEKVEKLVASLELADWINTLPNGIDSYVGERGGIISGGQAQRISIARAIYQEPNLLILDEATNALDTVSKQIVTDYIRSLNERGLTVIQIAHQSKDIKYAKKIFTLEKGSISH